MNIKYFRTAKKLAESVDHQFKIGAVLVRGHSIIGKGKNNMHKGHPVMSYYAEDNYKDFIGSHAEHNCVRGLRPYDIGRGKLYVYRHRRNGTQGMARPCIACVGLLIERGVREVFFSKKDEGFGHLRL
jgi:tRNA(Arg) A34 adenosine deaminase TadA